MSEHDNPLAELRKIRDDHANRFNYDVKAIMDNPRSREKASGRKIVSIPPKPVLQDSGS